MSREEEVSLDLARPNSEALFDQAEKEWDRRNFRSALRLFREAGEAGHPGALLNLGYFYDRGIGVRRSRSAALLWYRRAWRKGDPFAASNIATIWRDARKMNRALAWFKKSVRAGNVGANLEIAKHYMENEKNPRRALAYLQRLLTSRVVSEVDLEEAKRLAKGVARNIRRQRG